MEKKKKCTLWVQISLQPYLKMISNRMKITSYKGFSLEFKICYYFIAKIISRHCSKMESVQYYSAEYSKTGRLIFNQALFAFSQLIQEKW